MQPDWVDTNKIAIPQADEQQRLLVEPDHADGRATSMPLPRFWYLPRGEKAVVVMSGDDHSPSQAPGGTASHFDRFKALSPAGCSVANWECVRVDLVHLSRTAPLTNAQAAAYIAEGFEVGAAPARRVLPDDVDHRRRSSPTFYDTQLAAFAGEVHEHPGAGLEPHPLRLLAATGRSNAKVELAHGIRMDAQLLPLPRRLDRREARLHERRRLPDALRRPRRHADRRLPGRTRT